MRYPSLGSLVKTLVLCVVFAAGMLWAGQSFRGRVDAYAYHGYVTVVCGWFGYIMVLATYEYMARVYSAWNRRRQALRDFQRHIV